MPTRPIQVIDVPCPSCHAATGQLFSVGTDGPGRFLFGYRCRACGHEWDERRRLPGAAADPAAGAVRDEA